MNRPEMSTTMQQEYHEALNRHTIAKQTQRSLDAQKDKQGERQVTISSLYLSAECCFYIYTHLLLWIPYQIFFYMCWILRLCFIFILLVFYVSLICRTQIYIEHKHCLWCDVLMYLYAWSIYCTPCTLKVL